MCIIAIKPRGQKLFGEKTIRTMFRNNPDGAGLMFNEDNKVRYIKGFMRVEQLLAYLNERDWVDKNLVLHFRLGTSGLMDEQNCHPFPVYDENDVNGTTDIAVVHNGILSRYSYDNDLNSDTYHFTEEVLANLDYGFQNNHNVMFLLSELIGDYNKLCFLDKEGNIRLIGNFIRDDGFLYSNYSYKS